MYLVGRILQRRGSEKSDPRVSRRLERKSQAFGLAVDSIMEKLKHPENSLHKIGKAPLPQGLASALGQCPDSDWTVVRRTHAITGISDC